nr:uncharacterized protein LOC109169411 [Ipomoea trifida]
MDSNALSALSAQRSSEDSDLLERSTRKRKVNDGTSSAALPVPAETQPLDDTMAPPSSVEGVGGVLTPAVDLPASAMQIEDVRDGIQSVAPDPVADTPIPSPIANAVPRSYLDTVVGSGSGAAPFLLPALSDDEVEDSIEDDDPLCPTIRFSAKEMDQIRAPWRQSLIIKVMGRRVGYAYLLRRLNTMWHPKGRMELIALENDYFLPVETGSEVVRPTSRARRANVIVNERQIENDRAMARAETSTETEQVASRQSRGSGSRRAAEEDEHVVIRGEMGGQVIHSTRVVNVDVPTVSNEESADHSREHHTDPPDDFDVEGDVVMEIEDQNGERNINALRG